MAQHIPKMRAFHQRYMASNRACRHWVQGVRKRDIEIMLSQHDRPFVDKDKITAFLNWFKTLECGVDLL